MPYFPDPFDENPSSSPDLRSVGDTLERGQPGRSGLIPVYLNALPPRGQTAQIVALSNPGLSTITYYMWSGSAWVAIGGGGASDHGGLTGLADDDHTQYVLEAAHASPSYDAGHHTRLHLSTAALDHD